MRKPNLSRTVFRVASLFSVLLSRLLSVPLDLYRCITFCLLKDHSPQAYLPGLSWRSQSRVLKSKATAERMASPQRSASTAEARASNNQRNDGSVAQSAGGELIHAVITHIPDKADLFARLPESPCIRATRCTPVDAITGSTYALFLSVRG